MYKTVFMEEDSLEDKEEVVLESEAIDEGSIEGSKNTIRSIHIVDTAGIRQKKKIKSFIESQSVFRSFTLYY